MLEWPTQGHAALCVTSLSVFITLTLLIIGLRGEKKRRADDQDEH